MKSLTNTWVAMGGSNGGRWQIGLSGAALALAIAAAAPGHAASTGCETGTLGPTPDRTYPRGMCAFDDGLRNGYARYLSFDGSVVLVSGLNADYRPTVLRFSLGRYERLGDLDQTVFMGSANGLSQDGSVAIGAADDGLQRAYRWTADLGLVDLGTLRADNSGVAEASGMSSDGQFVVGFASTDDSDEFARAYLWSARDGMRDLGSLMQSQPGYSAAKFVSDDGTVVAGFSANDAVEARVFRWTDEGGMVDLGTLKSDSSGYAFSMDMSADGNAIVGYSINDDGFDHAFFWSSASGEMQDLGTLRQDGQGNSYARAVSRDGTTAVGYAASVAGPYQAFLWRDGRMVGLGSLKADQSGGSTAKAVSADGSVVVGSAETSLGNHAFYWSAATGRMVDLGTLRSAGDGFSEALGVSGDGSTVVGFSLDENYALRSFIWRGQMQDYSNLIASFPAVAAATEEVIDRSEAEVTRVMASGCAAAEGQGCLALGGNLTQGAGAGAESSLASFTYGRGLPNGWQVGAAASLGQSGGNGAVFAADRVSRLAVWSRWEAGGAAADRGLAVEAGLGWGATHGTLQRGAGFENVMMAQGAADLTTLSARAAVGFGFGLGPDWTITPRLGITRFHSARSAYAETGSDFNAEYDALTVGRTLALIDIRAARALGDGGKLTVGLGVEDDLSADRTVLTGTSSLPGMESLAVKGGQARRAARGQVQLGYVQTLDTDRSLAGSLGLRQAANGGRAEMQVGLSYGLRF